MTPECYEGLHNACDSDACTCGCHVDPEECGGSEWSYAEEWPEDEQ
jgi:hypothetical protein